MNTPLKLVWKFDSCLDLNTPWIWTETWFKQASSWVKTKIWWWKCDYPAEMSYIVDISLPEISCVFQMFTFVTSCCSPHISTSQQKSSTECLIWCQSGCVRILPFDRLRGLCHSTVSCWIFTGKIFSDTAENTCGWKSAEKTFKGEQKIATTSGFFFKKNRWFIRLCSWFLLVTLCLLVAEIFRRWCQVDQCTGR